MIKIALNAWFLDSDAIFTTGSGQYARNLVQSLKTVAPDIQLELVKPGRRGDIDKVWFEQSTFPRAAKAMRADVAWVPYWAPPLSSPVPVVTTIHDVIPLALKAYQGNAKHRIYTALVRAGSASAAQILTDSEASAADIARLLQVDPARVTTVPLAVEARYTPAIPDAEFERVRQKYGLPERYVLYLGGFDPRKNIETLMQVYGWAGPTIGEEYPLVLTGTPETLTTASNGQSITLGEMAQTLQVQDDLRYIGRVDEADKPALYAGARVFLYTSSYEGFGLPALEAMACGTPIIGSNATSIGEVVGNAGMLMEPMDARKMAGALIASTTEDELNARLRQRALLRAAQFSWERTAIDTAAVLRKAAAR